MGVLGYSITSYHGACTELGAAASNGLTPDVKRGACVNTYREILLAVSILRIIFLLFFLTICWVCSPLKGKTPAAFFYAVFISPEEVG